MSTHIHYLQHVPFEGLGSMAEYFREHGATTSATHWYRGDAPPGLDSFDWLIVMGGPMNVDEEVDYPWLKAEKALIRAAIDAGKIVLGVCLGAQLIARVTGGKVERNAHKEIGWFPVRRSAEIKDTVLSSVLPEQFEAFHWHSDRLELPPGATHLASSEACDNQAFCIGDKVFGFQFHLETTPRLAQALIENAGDDLDGSAYVQNPEQITAGPEQFERLNRIMSRILDAIVASH